MAPRAEACLNSLLAAHSQMFDPSANADAEGVWEIPMEGALEAIESASSY